MFFYSAVIIISTWLFYISQKLYKKSPLFWNPYLFFILLLSSVGGLRDINVGYDLDAYGTTFFYNDASYSSLTDLISSLNGEYLYHILNWLCAKIIPEVHSFLFISELIKIILISSFALSFKDRINSTLFIFVYLIFFYILGFNNIRQLFAFSFVVYAMKYIEERRFILYIIFCIIAGLIHSTGLVGLFILPILYSAYKRVPILIVLLVISLSYFANEFIIQFLVDSGESVYAEKAALYAETEGEKIPKTNILIGLYLIFVFYSLKFKMYMDDFEIRVFKSSLFCYLFFILLSSVYNIAFRFSWYFFPWLIYIMSKASLKMQDADRFRFEFGLVFVLIIYFLVYCNQGFEQAIPYSSILLGI